MFDNIMKALYVLLSNIPFVFSCYYPFMDRLRVSFKYLFIIILFICTIQSAGLILLSQYNFGDDRWKELYYLAFVLIFAALLFAMIKDNFLKIFFVYLVVIIYTFFVLGNANFISVSFFPSYYHTAPYLITNLVILIILAITYPLIFYLLRYTLKSTMENTKPDVWKIIWFVPFTFIVVGAFYTFSIVHETICEWRYITTRYFIAVSAAFACFILLHLLYQAANNTKLEETIRITNQQLTLQSTNYQRLTEHIAETRIAHHDLRQHLLVLESYIQSNDKARLQEYLKKYRRTLPENIETTLCNNHAVDAIIRHYINIAKAEGIQTFVNLKMLETSGISDLDLCIIFGNCLENAIEACEKMKTGNRFVKINATLIGNILAITIDNSFDGKINLKNGNFLSRKRTNEEGIGLSSIRAVVEKYEGIANFEFDTQIFKASIMLNKLNRNKTNDLMEIQEN